MAFVTQRTLTSYLSWIKQEFDPITLATTDDAIKQFVENAVRYWNTHSFYKIAAMVSYTAGQTRVQLPAGFATVAAVYPNSKSEFVWNDSPLWTLTSVQVLDSMTSDLILQSEAFRSYRIYTGTNFRYTFEPNLNSQTEGGYLYAVNVPNGTSSLYVLGTKAILPTEDITDEDINQWILHYTKALVKMCEGNALRKSGLVDLKNDGQELYNEGKDEKKELEEELAVNARWIIFAKRT